LFGGEKNDKPKSHPQLHANLWTNDDVPIEVQLKGMKKQKPKRSQRRETEKYE